MAAAGPTVNLTCEFHYKSLCSVVHSYRVDSRQPSASRFQPYGSRSTTFLTTHLYGSCVMKVTRIRPETGLPRSPEVDPEPRRPGAITMGPSGVGIVVGLVIDGHRGRRGATEIPVVSSHNSVGKAKGLLCMNARKDQGFPKKGTE